MFTVETESDYTKVVALDQTGQFEDLEMYLEEDGTVFLRQYSNELGEFQLCVITYHQLLDIMDSLDSADGAHKTLLHDKYSG